MGTSRMGERATASSSTWFSELINVWRRNQIIETANGAPVIPYEHREVIYRHNPNVVLMTSRGVTGYYLESREQTVVVVYSDRIVRSSYDNAARFNAAISELESFNIRRIDLRNGIIKSVLSFAASLLFLELIAFLARVQW